MPVSVGSCARFSFLKVMAVCLAGSIILSACAPAATPTTSPGAPSSPLPTQVSAPTQTALATPVPASPGRPSSPVATAIPVTPVASGDSARPKLGGTVTEINPTPPPTLDALWQVSSALVILAAPVYNGLLQYDPTSNTEIIADLATSWNVSPDGTKVTFQLAEAKWHDGKSFTADDEVAKWKLWLQPPPGKASNRAAEFTMVKDVVARGPRTLEFQLKDPSNGFINWIAHGNIYVMPKHIIEPDQQISSVSKFIGTGPFRLEQYSRGVGAILKKNKDYFRTGMPYIDELRIVEIQDAGTQVAALLAGRIDLTGGNIALSRSNKEQIERSGRAIAVKPFFRGESVTLMMNNNRKPFDDIRVRRAISLAVDRQKAINILGEGVGQVGTLFPPVGQFARSQQAYLSLPGFRPKDSPGGQEDLKTAKRLMAEAGYPEGFKTTIRTRAGFTTYVSGAEFFANELSTKLGISASISLEDTAKFDLTRARRDMDMTVVAANPLNAYAVGRNVYWMPPVKGDVAGYNETNYGNERSRDLYFAQEKEQNKDLRAKAIRELEDLLINEAPFVTSYWLVAYNAYWNHVKNYEPGWGPHNNHRFERVWRDSDSR